MTVRLWNTTTGEQMQKLVGHNTGVQAVAFSLDGQVVVSASYDGTVLLWNTTTGEQIQKLEVRGSTITTVAFSPNRQVVVLASEDRTVQLWNTTTAEQIQKLEVPGSSITAVAFSPDKQVIALVSDDKKVRLWDAATGEVIQVLSNDHTVHHISFTIDRQTLQTDAGTFLLEAAAVGLPTDICIQTTSLELGDQWIRDKDEDLLWLPHEVRGICSAIHGRLLVIGQSSGGHPWNFSTSEYAITTKTFFSYVATIRYTADAGIDQARPFISPAEFRPRQPLYGTRSTCTTSAQNKQLLLANGAVKRSNIRSSSQQLVAVLDTLTVDRNSRANPQPTFYLLIYLKSTRSANSFGRHQIYGRDSWK
nr:vegetative incompatibility protein het-e-1 [Quercus suber]